MRKTFLPSTFLYKFYWTLYSAYIAAIEQSTIPKYVLVFFSYYVTVSTSLSLLPFSDQNFNLNMFRVLVYFISGKQQKEKVPTQFFVYLVIFVLLIASLILSSLFSLKSNRFKHFISNLIIVNLKILVPIFYCFMCSQVGEGFAVLIKDGFDASVLLYTLIILCFTLLLLLTTHLVTNNHVEFVGGITSFFTAKLGTIYYSTIGLMRILAFLNESDNKIVSIIFSILSFALIIFIGLYCAMTNIFINQDTTISETCTLYGPLFYVLLSSFIELETPIILGLFCISSFIGWLVNHSIIKHHIRRALVNFDDVTSQDTSFNSVYPKLNISFFTDLRNALIQGNEMMLQPEFYERIMQEFQSTEEFIIHFLRIVSIYKSNYVALENAYDDVRRDTSSITEKLFYVGIERIINTRKSSETKECKRSIKKVKLEIESHKRSLVNYWKSIQDGNFGEVFTLVERCKKEERHITGTFEKLISDYSNCSKVYRQFINYLTKVACNVDLANYYKARLDIVTSCGGNLPDDIENKAKEMFILLPYKLKEEKFQINLTENPAEMSTSSQHSMGSMSTSLDETEQNEFDMSSQNIRATCSNIKFTTNNWLTFIMLLSFIATFCIGVVALCSQTMTGLNIYNGLLSFVGTFTSLLISVPKNSYNILSDGLVQRGVLKTKEDEFAVIHATEEVVKTYDSILSDTVQISNFIDDYVTIIPDSMQYTTDVSSLRRASKCTMNIYDKSSGVVSVQQGTLGYAAAINELVKDFLHYSSEDFDNNVDFSDEAWFLSSVTNEETICTVFKKFTEYIRSDMMVYADTINSYSITYPTICTVVDVLIVIIGLIFYAKLTKEFNNIAKTLSKIPVVAIIQRCNKLVTNDDDSNEHEAARASKLDSMSQTGEGVSHTITLIIFIIANIIFIIEPWVFGVALNNDDIELRSLPTQAYHISSVAALIYRQSAILKRCIAKANTKAIGVDDSVDLETQYATNLDSLVNAISLLLLGSESGTEYSIITNKYQTSEMFLAGEEEVSKDDTEHDFIAKYPVIESIEFFVSEMNYFKSHLTDPDYMKNDNERLLNILHFTDQKLGPILAKGDSAVKESANNLVSEKLSAIISFIVLALIVNSICAIVSVTYQSTIIDTVRYSLTTLCMLRADIVQSNDAVSLLLAGDFTTHHNYVIVDQHYVDAIEDSTDAMIFNVDVNANIISMNKAATGFFRDNKAKSFGEFTEVTPDIQAILVAKTKQMYSIEREFTEEIKGANGEPTTNKYKMKLDIYKPSLANYAIVIAQRDREKEKFDKLREARNQLIDNIIYRINPHDIRNLYSYETTMVIVERVIICAVRVLNFELTEETIDKTLEFTSQFNKANYAASKEASDCVIVKKLGTVIFGICNMRNHNNNFEQVVADMCTYIKSLKRICEEKGIKITTAACSSSKVAVGRLSQKTSNFNIYGLEVEEAYRFVRRGNENELRIDQKVFNFLPKDKTRNTLEDKNDVDCFVVNISDL